MSIVPPYIGFLKARLLSIKCINIWSRQAGSNNNFHCKILFRRIIA